MRKILTYTEKERDREGKIDSGIYRKKLNCPINRKRQIERNRHRARQTDTERDRERERKNESCERWVSIIDCSLKRHFPC